MQLGLFEMGGDQSPRRTMLLGEVRRDASWMDNIRARAKVLRRASAPPKQKKQEKDSEQRKLLPGEENQLRIPGL